MALVLWGSLKNWLTKKKKTEDFVAQEPPLWAAFGDTMKSWKDPAYAVSAEAYLTARRNDVVTQPMGKFAEKIGAMSLTVVGQGKLRDELQKIVDQAKGMSDGLEWLAWAKIEGVRFLSHRAVMDEQIGYYVPDARGCGAMKWKAGGNIYWAGWAADLDNPKRSIGKVPETNVDPEKPMSEKDGQWFDRKEWTVFRPGAGTNPEGELDIALQVFLIAESAQLLDKAMRIYSDRYSLPRELLKKMVDQLRPDEMASTFTSVKTRLATANARTRIPMNAQDALELLEPKGTTWGFLTEYRSMLERRVHKLICGEDVSSGGQESGDRGGRDMADKQLNSAAISFGKKIADALTNDWLEWVIEKNKGLLPRLKSGEPKPYLALRPPVEKQRISVAELVQVIDRDVELNSDFVYEVVGTDKPEGVGPTFKSSRDGAMAARQKAAEAKAEAGVDENGDPVSPEGDKPSNEGGSTQRNDREQKDSGIPSEDTRKQNPDEDLRNLK